MGTAGPRAASGGADGRPLALELGWQWAEPRTVGCQSLGRQRHVRDPPEYGRTEVLKGRRSSSMRRGAPCACRFDFRGRSYAAVEVAAVLRPDSRTSPIWDAVPDDSQPRALDQSASAVPYLYANCTSFPATFMAA